MTHTNSMNKYSISLLITDISINIIYELDCPMYNRS